MTNSKFLRKVFKFQAKFQIFLSQLITKIYNAEYMDSAEITVKLPPPMFLNVVNTNQLMDNTNAMANNIVEIYTAGEDDEKIKALFTKNIKLYYLRSYIDDDIISSILDKSKQESKKEPAPQE